MNEIKCPNCGSLFSIDEKSYATIVKQIRDKEFQEEVEAQKSVAVSLAEAKKDKQIADLQAEIEKQKAVALAEKEAALRDAENESSNQLMDLREKLSRAETEKELAIEKAVSAAKEVQHRQESRIVELEGKVSQMESSFALREKELAESHSLELRKKDEAIAYYKDYKARMSTKMVGESLEQHCEIEFSKIRATAFPDAYFEKDNDTRTGTKGDYIFRDYDDDGEEYISIMFEMKNEMDDTATKHRNEEFLKKLDKDRKAKKCEYAVLVTLLEQDNEYYNTGIVDMSYRYPKMYVIRPQFFVPLIGLLRDAAKTSLPYRREWKAVQLQNEDLEAFENKLNDFKSRFSRDCGFASDRFRDAIKEIDNSIERLQEAKKNLLTSVKHLSHANEKAEDLTIKQLTSGSPGLAERFKIAESASLSV